MSSELKAKLENLEKRIENLEQKSVQKEKEISRLSDELVKKDKQIEHLHTLIKEVEKQKQKAPKKDINVRISNRIARARKNLIKLPPISDSDNETPRTTKTQKFAKDELETGKKEQEVDMSKLMSKNKELGSIKGYHLLKRIGKGVMSTVCLASNDKTGELYVVKFLTEVSRETKSLKRFFQELRVSLRLEHPNIVKVIDFDMTPKDIWYLVMEYIRGSSLGNIISNRGPIPPKTSVLFAMKIASALDYALQKNVLHRDLKPDNIIIEQNTSNLKVIDFGVGKVMGESRLTLTSDLLGTPRYMSPEQLLESRTVDHRTDIYSLGATLYHMLCGRAPYSEVSGNHVELIMTIARNKPTPIKNMARNIPDSVANIVARAMERDLGKRYQTPKEILQHIQEVYEQL